MLGWAPGQSMASGVGALGFRDLYFYFNFRDRTGKVANAPEQCSFLDNLRRIHSAIVDSRATGYENISSVVGIPMSTLLAEWAAALYVDDRVPNASARLTLPSWNLFEIFELRATESERLVPRSRGFASFTDAFSVRAGSSAYFRVSGANRRPTAMRVRNLADQPLPAVIQVFVVRLR